MNALRNMFDRMGALETQGESVEKQISDIAEREIGEALKQMEFVANRLEDALYLGPSLANKGMIEAEERGDIGVGSSGGLRYNFGVRREVMIPEQQDDYIMQQNIDEQQQQIQDVNYIDSSVGNQIRNTNSSLLSANTIIGNSLDMLNQQFQFTAAYGPAQWKKDLEALDKEKKESTKELNAKVEQLQEDLKKNEEDTQFLIDSVEEERKAMLMSLPEGEGGAEAKAAEEKEINETADEEVKKYNSQAEETKKVLESKISQIKQDIKEIEEPIQAKERTIKFEKIEKWAKLPRENQVVRMPKEENAQDNTNPRINLAPEFLLNHPLNEVNRENMGKTLIIPLEIIIL
jgi:hypothetical protein